MEEKKEGFVTKKYRELIALGKEALDRVTGEFEARKAEKDLEKEIIGIEQEIAEQDMVIQQAKSQRPFKLEAILNAIDKKDIKERKLRQAKELQAELF